jgi:hypothetical protein
LAGEPGVVDVVRDARLWGNPAPLVDKLCGKPAPLVWLLIYKKTNCGRGWIVMS